MCAKSQCSSIIKSLFPPPAELFPLTATVQKQSLGHQIPAPTRGDFFFFFFFFLSLAARLVFKEIIIIGPLPAELCGAERARLAEPRCSSGRGDARPGSYITPGATRSIGDVGRDSQGTPSLGFGGQRTPWGLTPGLGSPLQQPPGARTGDVSSKFAPMGSF